MSPTEQIPRGLTIPEVAKSQRISEAAVWRLVQQERIPSYKVGGSRRIPAAYLDELQRSHGETEVEKAAAKLVADWPKLTDEQRTRVTELLKPVRRGGDRA